MTQMPLGVQKELLIKTVLTWVRQQASGQPARNGGVAEERTIDEEDLPQFQEVGWTFVAELNGGRVVVRR